MIDGTDQLAVTTTDNSLPMFGRDGEPALCVKGDFCWSAEHRK